MQLTILMPCLNEAETLASCIKKAKHWIKNSKISAEILVADNGSTDGSQKIAKSMGARVVNVKEKGYGSAIFYGSLVAKGEWIIVGDSDDSYDFSKLDNFVKKLNEGYELVVGNRFIGGIEKGAMPWKNRYIGNPILTKIGRIFFNCPVKDFHCGLRAYTKSAFKKMDLRTSGMEFASEMIIKANLFNMKIAEVPTTLSKDGRSRPSHLRPWRDGWRHLRFMLLFSPLWLFFIPGLLLFLLSGILYSFLLFGPLQLGSITFDVHTLFYAQTGIIIGLLSMIFSTFIKAFGIKEGLLPKSSRLQNIQKYLKPELSALIGFLMIIIGLIIGFTALLTWGKTGFGQLTTNLLLRKISFSTTLIILGSEILLAVFVLEFLTIPKRKI